eukprot:CAMPEP_0113323978 /NCGR_PEP_ID=MMETSP0010_2-20120614/16720_1 /TAXON_ID=216773 ORGANISM="Corethron hystrix, Strain 308" /NCGR_SAMPLE_ID=MMETSP0010_2 /ASSEMBLY_ACC=CAM_ASM_000155 /LENGTH=145 /DNA_ID=CAMNT_0000183167 /DNA_START=97 /DNA_END=531 /DNA_ORIENTATION=+ /assembly_acc=CAM_ASM_000155
MVYGSGTPDWASGKSLSTPQNRKGNVVQDGKLNSYHNSYQAPNLSTSYKADQSKTMEEAVKMNYEADGNAQAVLAQMTAQRQQLNTASNNVHEMKEMTEKAKKELQTLVSRGRKQRMGLYTVIGILSTTDLYLFYRIVRCGGSFF